MVTENRATSSGTALDTKKWIAALMARATKFFVWRRGGRRWACWPSQLMLPSLPSRATATLVNGGVDNPPRNMPFTGLGSCACFASP